MADQMKYLLATVALCLLAGCGKPEANNPAADKPESEKTTYEKLVSSISEGQATYFESDEAKEYGAEVCRAMAHAEPYGAASRRAVMQDYGFSDQMIDSLEQYKNLERLVPLPEDADANDRLIESCGSRLVMQITVEAR